MNRLNQASFRLKTAQDLDKSLALPSTIFLHPGES